MNDRRIVERLREWPLSEKLALEAADRIEALEAALRKIAEMPGTFIDARPIARATLAEGQDK